MRRRIDRILCAIDLSPVSVDLVSYAARIASEFGAVLYICHIIDLPTVSVYGEAVFDPLVDQQRFMDVAQREIENLAGDLKVEWEPVVRIGHTTEEITKEVIDRAVDLVIGATHGRTGIKRLFLGSVTERLIRALPCPFLVLRALAADSSRRTPNPYPYKKILVGCDFSSDSEAAFDFSLSLAQEFESELHLVHVVEPIAYREFFRFQTAGRDGLDAGFSESIEKKLVSMVPDDALNWCTLKTAVLVGKPYAEIVGYAEKNSIDLIALGVRGHGMVEEILIGSTTDRVIRRASCPVLSVNPNPT